MLFMPLVHAAFQLVQAWSTA